MYMVVTTEGFFEVAMESWPEYDLNPRPLNSVELSGHEFNSDSGPTLYSHCNFIVCSVSSFTLAIAFISRHVATFLLIEVCLR